MQRQVIVRLPIYLHPLHEDDYPKLLKLWIAAGCIDVRQTDTREALARFLYRNPTCNFAAYAGSRLVGAVLAGHDGWRGHLYHMAVKPDYRERGIGAQLVNAAVGAIKREGIPRVHCLVKRDNLIAQQFWEACSFKLRDEFYDYSL
jgi:ribosomal protein S18 acetylase RimI-like enzyme